jgi:hypothetical protein
MTIPLRTLELLSERERARTTKLRIVLPERVSALI